MKKILFTLSLFLAASAMTFAQDGWNWPEDAAKKAKAMEKNALYSDMLTAENYEAAKVPLDWLLKEVPDLNASIYIQGVKIYENLSESTTGQRQKDLQDSTVLLYDLRMLYFHDEKNVTNRKAYDAYQVWKSRKDKYQELFELEKSTFEFLGDDIIIGNTMAYMDAARKYKLSGGDLNDLEIIDIYDQISEVLEKKKAEGVANADRYAEVVDKLFNATITINCSIIDEQLFPKYIDGGKELKDAERIVKFALAGSCTSSESFLTAAKQLVVTSPEYGLIRLIALRSKMNGNYDEATKYFTEALKYIEDNFKQAEIYLELSDIASKKGNKVQARSYAYKVLEADPAKTDAYVLIGDLYFKSGPECKGGQDVVKDRAVYIAAYEMYQRGSNSERMAVAKEQFPSKEDLFNYGYEVGQTLAVGCWVGESVTLYTRD
ncbi:MAG: tetratricopeptide (TPR) repeat protein [Marivirga sp.]|jgi:tetratricopeptide (TPR) repeat protein